MIFSAFQIVLASACLTPTELTHLSQPLQTTDQALELVDQLGSRFRACNDIRGMFAEVYSSTLRAIQKEIVKHSFRNEFLVKKMLVTHTNLYREALYMELTNHFYRMPESWKKTFFAIRSHDYKPGTILILSMNAHIAFDMTKTLVEMNIPFELKSVKSDYDKITQILRDSMNDLWASFRIYDDQDPVIPVKAELAIMVEYAAWLRNKAWRDAKKCASSPAYSARCLDSVDFRSGVSAEYYSSFDFLVH